MDKTLDGDSLDALVRCSCGCTLFHRNYKARGIWRQLIDTSKPRIEVVDSSTDELKVHGEPVTMRCAECGKKHRNPDAPNGALSNGGQA